MAKYMGYMCVHPVEVTGELVCCWLHASVPAVCSGAHPMEWNAACLDEYELTGHGIQIR